MEHSHLQSQTVVKPSHSDAGELLGRFVDGGRMEKDFEELVRTLGGVVFTSALRQTGDALLAEEVAQNVFAILARKAATVRKHAAPMAWIFKTTKHEAAKAMRAERRRHRKHQALATHRAERQEVSLPHHDDPWREALPHLDESLDQLAPQDREAVLQRFFYQRKFREIAVATGQSEAACKMRVRRALEKLAGFLRAKGVVLSGTAVASCLTAEMAKAAPVSLVAASGKILTGCQSLSTLTIFTNSIQTMNTVKSATIATAAVIALAAGPMVWQNAQARNLENEVSRLEAEREEQSRMPSSRSGRSRVNGKGTGARYTVRDMLADSKESLDPDAFVQEMLEIVSSQNITGMIRLFVQLSQFDSEQVESLLIAANNLSVPADDKEDVLDMLADLVPEGDSQVTLERGLKNGFRAHRLGPSLDKWAQADPEAALAWFEKNKAEGRLAGKELHERQESTYFGYLLAGIARKQPDRALALFQEANERDQNEAGRKIGVALLQSLSRSEYRAMMKKLTTSSANSSVRTQLLMGGALAMHRVDGAEAVVEWLGELDLKPSEHGEHLARVAMDLNGGKQASVSERGDWLLEQVDEEMRGAALKGFVRDLTYNGQPVNDWLSSLKDDDTRDEGWTALSSTQLQRGYLGKAVAAAGRIRSEEERHRSLELIAKMGSQYHGADSIRETFEQAGLNLENFQPKQ